MNEQVKKTTETNVVNHPTKENRTIHPQSFKLADGCFVRYSIFPDHGTTLKEMLKPSYWSHIASKLRTMDRLNVASADGTWIAELYVHRADTTTAKVSVLSEYKFDADVETSSDGDLESGWKGPVNGWCVWRKSDDVYVAKNLPDKKAGLMYVANNTQG